MRVGLDRVAVALVGSWGALMISAATFPLFLGQNDGLVAVLLLFRLDVMLVRSLCVVGCFAGIFSTVSVAGGGAGAGTFTSRAWSGKAAAVPAVKRPKGAPALERVEWTTAVQCGAAAPPLGTSLRRKIPSPGRK